MKRLTTKQQAALNYITEYQNKNHTRPTNLEIGQYLGISATAAQFKIDGLLRKRIIKLDNIYIFSS